MRALDALAHTPQDAAAIRDPGPVAAASRAAPIGDPLRESLRRGPPARLAYPSTLLPEPGEGQPVPGSTDAPRAERNTVEEGPSTAARGAPAARASPSLPWAATARTARSEESASLDLSPTGRLLQAALAAAPPQPATGTDAGSPLLAGPPVPAAMATALAGAIAQSGIFYESHLARWVRDGHLPDVLAREPQARWGGERSGEQTTAGSAAPERMPSQALPLLQRQLEALDARSITWTGMLWPGQPARLTIAEEDRGAREGAPEPEPGVPWQTRIELTLPVLGRVAATLALCQDTVQIRVSAATAPAARRLHDAQPLLAAALGNHALALAGFAVADHHAD